MSKEIIIKIEHKEGTDDETVTINKSGITWTETIGYIERAKSIIINSKR